jgi:prephenate dehydratase
VHGEVLLRVRHNLLTVPETRSRARRIAQVRSHPQALAQCETYLNRRKLAAVPWYDTAGSAKDLAADPVEGVA